MIRRLAAGLAILTAGLVVSCGPPTITRTACAPGKVCIERGANGESQTLDPHKSSSTTEDEIDADLFVGLTQFDANANVVPGMATSWEASPDGLIWTFHLRDAKWSDGTPVTADDFVFSLGRAMDPKTASPYASLLYLIKNAQAVNDGKMPPSAIGARAIDAHTLEITLNHPAPYLPNLAVHTMMAPIPRHVYEKWGDDHWADPGHMVGNGPYTLAIWKLGDKIEERKNPLFWNADKVCGDVVRWYPITDSISAERRVRRGELDVHQDIQSNRIAYLRQPDQIPAYIHTHTWLGIDYLAFNETLPKFQDKRVRQALSMAVDRDFITKKLMRGGQEPAYTFVPPGVANYALADEPAWASWTLAQRQAEARRLLAAAGYGPRHPLTVEISHRNTSDPSLIMPAIQADWRSIGVDVTLLSLETQLAYQAYEIKDFEIADAGWIADYNDPMSFLYLMDSKTGPKNYGGYASPAYDAMLRAADHEPDLKKREEILRHGESAMLDDAPMVNIFYYINKNIVAPRVTGFADNIVDKHRSQYLCLKN
jgi:oligopeptide transport system substrate-binding protein